MKFGFRDKRYLAIVQAAQAKGWDIKLNGEGHVQLTPPGGGKPVTLSASKSGGDFRSYYNARSTARKVGLDI